MQRVRRMALVFVGLWCGLVSVVELMGIFINKAAPLEWAESMGAQ